MKRQLRVNQISSDQQCVLLEAVIRQLTEFVVVLLDLEGNFLTWHPGVEHNFGYAPDEFVGRHLEILYPVADRLRGAVERELDEAVEKGRASDTCWLIKKSAERIYVEGITIALRDEEGHPIGFGKVIHDVTARRNAEDGLLALTRALGQSTVIVRRWDGSIDHWTEGCERLYGWTKEEALGKPLQTLLKTSNYSDPPESLQERLLATGEWKGEVEQTARDGTVLQVMTTWALLPSATQDFSSVIETHTDITDLIRMRREVDNSKRRLEDLASELERSNRELEEFARITSHDLSSPIISTQWLLDLVLSRYGATLDDNGCESLRQASANLQRMSELVEAVLTHARVGRDTIRSEEPVSSEDALAAALANLEAEVQQLGAEIIFGNLPKLHVRPQPLSQLFQNIISNAMKYRRPEVSPQLEIEAERDQVGWRFSFRDNGIGIAPEFHKRIFQPMQRLHGHDIAGSGIGLATCKKIVERAGGSIWVESAEGAGATFYLTLP
jgi:PAS domain S-box-containing protein